MHVGMAEAVMEALHLYRKGKADFADYLMLAESKAAGAKRLASFDRMLCKEQHFACLPEDCAP